MASREEYREKLREELAGAWYLMEEALRWCQRGLTRGQGFEINIQGTPTDSSTWETLTIKKLPDVIPTVAAKAVEPDDSAL